jgi:hypothetical protein
LVFVFSRPSLHCSSYLPLPSSYSCTSRQALLKGEPRTPGRPRNRWNSNLRVISSTNNWALRFSLPLRALSTLTLPFYPQHPSLPLLSFPTLILPFYLHPPFTPSLSLSTLTHPLYPHSPFPPSLTLPTLTHPLYPHSLSPPQVNSYRPNVHSINYILTVANN